MNRLRGSSHGSIDPKGRLKIPAVFRQHIEDCWGRRLYITSRDGQLIRVYPLPVWEELEGKVAAIPSTDPDRELYDFWTNFYGGEAEVDNQGRALIPQVLREEIAHTGEVVVIGLVDHLLVATKEQMKERLKNNPLTREQLTSLSNRGI